MGLPDFHLLQQEARQLLGITLDERQMQLLETYASEMLAWNRNMNLTAITDPQQVRQKHFLDSLSCLLVLPVKPGRVIDVGSGAGFPGLVLRIVRPDLQLMLVDSVAKKTGFLSHIVQVLGLRDVTMVTARAEKLGQDLVHRQTYDWALARALAPMPVLVEYLLPLVRVGGSLLAQKGADAAREVEGAGAALAELGGELEQVLPVGLPGGEEHSLVVVKKVKPTPDKYPRREGIPAKRPL
jgi:16S rRNA (guanine527-N7)-methyltransferase